MIRSRDGSNPFLHWSDSEEESTERGIQEVVDWLNALTFKNAEKGYVQLVILRRKRRLEQRELREDSVAQCVDYLVSQEVPGALQIERLVKLFVGFSRNSFSRHPDFNVFADIDCDFESAVTLREFSEKIRSFSRALDRVVRVREERECSTKTLTDRAERSFGRVVNELVPLAELWRLDDHLNSIQTAPMHTFSDDTVERYLEQAKTHARSCVSPNLCQTRKLEQSNSPPIFHVKPGDLGCSDDEIFPQAIDHSLLEDKNILYERTIIHN